MAIIKVPVELAKQIHTDKRFQALALDILMTGLIRCSKRIPWKGSEGDLQELFKELEEHGLIGEETLERSASLARQHFIWDNLKPMSAGSARVAKKRLNKKNTTGKAQKAVHAVIAKRKR